MSNSIRLLLPASLILGLAARGVLAQGCPESGQQSSGPDVIVGTLGQYQDFDISNYTGAGGLDAVSTGTTSCNLGDQELYWEAAPDTHHPVICQNLFRLKSVNGAYRFEQLGMSWLKHGFAALTEFNCCPNCQDPGNFSRLGVGCSDPYDSARNGGQFNAGPRWQVNATTGVHIQPQANPSFSGAMARRLQVKLTDIENSTTMEAVTKYYIEGQYTAADDAASGNKYNNASYRRVSVLQASPTNFTFGWLAPNPVDDTRRQESGVRAWKDFDPSVVETDIFTPEDSDANPNVMIAIVILAAQATDLGGGTWHYEYAMQNMNSDRSVFSFSIPVLPGVNVTNIGFHDVDYHDGDGIGNVTTDGTDWTGVRNPYDVTWSCAQTYTHNPNANALRWGTLYNFRFDADVPPDETPGTITLVQFKTINTVTALSVVPSVPACACPGDVNASNNVDGDDIAPFTQMYVNALPVSNCADVAAPIDGSLDDADVIEFTNLLIADTVCP
jgi:hypothetical protein